MTKRASSESYFVNLSETIGRMPFEAIDQVCEVLLRAYWEQRNIFVFGNGGSAALASHFACDLGKGTVNGAARRFRIFALTDNVPLITAWANDARFEDIFAEQIANFVQPEDVAFAISGSGNSPNVLNALHVARQAGATTIGLTGFQGGKLRNSCDICVTVPSNNMQIIEDLHLSVAHVLFLRIREQISCKVAAFA